jgi:hypothetical protein
MGNNRLVRRAGAPASQSLDDLGPLGDLAGRWFGSGFNMIAVPNHQGGSIFRLIVNATSESIDFTPITGAVPDRGSEQDDIEIFGLTYLQAVNDATTHEGIHVETGMWLNVPATASPTDPATIVRQSTIPHGDSVLAQGLATVVAGPPQFAPANTMPSPVPGQPEPPLGYTDPYLKGTFPPGFTMSDPNQALRDTLATQNDSGLSIASTTALPVDTATGGGILNTPFVQANANATRLTATFWIETVQRPDGSHFLQLQYTQTVLLVFSGVVWPHVSVGTLIKT